MYNLFIRLRKRLPANLHVTKARDDRQSKYALAGCRLDYLTGKYERGVTNDV